MGFWLVIPDEYVALWAGVDRGRTRR